MDQDNPAPRLLSRPGEGIYNDAAGSIEGNSPFQAVWLSDEVRDRYLARIREQADGNGSQEPGARSQDRFPGPFVFEGNAPADVRENVLLNAALEANPVQAPASARIWLGSPNSIKGPTEAVFRWPSWRWRWYHWRRNTRAGPRTSCCSKPPRPAPPTANSWTG